MNAMAGGLRLIDIGANLTDPVFQGMYRGKQRHESDFHAMLNRAQTHGVEKIIVTGGSLSESRRALELARSSCSNGMLYSTVGVHPTRCDEFDQDQTYLDDLLALAHEGQQDQKVVAIGECGLDYDRLEFCTKDVQRKYFQVQFELASYTGLPMFLHNRNTDGEFTALMRQNRDRFRSGVVHSFTGSMEEAKELVDLDLFIGINGCSLKTPENLKVAQSIPLDRLMLETDAPWCDIRKTHASHEYVRTTFQSKKAEKFEMGLCVKSRNEPCTMVQVLQVMAALHQMEPGKLAQIVHANTEKVFFHSTAASSDG